MQSLKIYVFIIATLTLGTAHASTKGEFLRNADGSIKLMNHYKALRACPAGTHLPSIRELCQIAQSYGAEGLVDKDPGGHMEISALNHNGRHDLFYFSAEGYQRPENDFGSEWIWSSSNPTYPTYPKTHAYFFRGDIAAPDYIYREGNNAQFSVYCVPNH